MKGKKLRILYVQKPSLGGTVTGLIDLVQGLDKQKFEPVVMFFKQSPYRHQFEQMGVQVITLTHGAAGQNGTDDKAQNRRVMQRLHGVNRYVGDLYVNLKKIYLFFIKDFPVAWRVQKVIRSQNIDVVHHNNNLPSDRAFVAGAAMARRIQICHIRTLAELTLVEKILARFVRKFIYMSRAIEKVYLKHGIGADKGCVVYDGFSSNAYDAVQPSQRKSFLEEFDLDASNQIVCNVGRIERWKGQDIFIKAMQQVIEQFPKAIGLIVGPTTNGSGDRQVFYEELMRLARELNISENIIFTGFRVDIPLIMKSAHIIVHSAAKPEPFGRVIVEGMLAAKPVIATAAGGVLDIIDDRKNGFLVPIDDHNAMASAIAAVLQKGFDGDEFGQNARHYARAKFSVSQNVKRIQGIYAQLTSRV